MPAILPVNLRRLRITKTSEGAPARAKIQALSCSVSDSRGNPARATAERDPHHFVTILHALGVWKVRLSRLWIWGLSRADAGLRAQSLAPSRGTNHLSAGCDAAIKTASDMNAGRCQFQPTAAEVSSPGVVSPQQWQGGGFISVCAFPRITRCSLPSVVILSAFARDARAGLWRFRCLRFGAQTGGISSPRPSLQWEPSHFPGNLYAMT